ncbi:ParA family protein, partial [Ruthenibacterium lactatiformans]
DYILLDCMASLGMLAVNVMMACDTVLLVSTPEEDSIEGLELASDFIQEAARALRKEIPVCGVLICRVDMRYRKSRSGVERIRQLFVPQYPIYQEMIPDRVCVADARNKQVSIIEYAPESEPARAYQVVCDSFVKEVEYHGIHTA